jgi:hypothetical protein
VSDAGFASLTALVRDDYSKAKLLVYDEPTKHADHLPVTNVAMVEGVLY